MLMLTRKLGEVVSFPELGIRVIVCKSDKHRVKLGIETPAGIKVVREEIVKVDVDLIKQ